MPDQITPKFRVWNRKSGKIWTVDKLIWDEDRRCYPIHKRSYLIYSDKDALMQSTGLFDIDGDEIFEGDIVRFVTFDAIEKVIYDPPCFKTSNYSLQGYECIIIGNIFENPEILESKNV